MTYLCVYCKSLDSFGTFYQYLHCSFASVVKRSQPFLAYDLPTKNDQNLFFFTREAEGRLRIQKTGDGCRLPVGLPYGPMGYWLQQCHDHTQGYPEAPLLVLPFPSCLMLTLLRVKEENFPMGQSQWSQPGCDPKAPCLVLPFLSCFLDIAMASPGGPGVVQLPIRLGSGVSLVGSLMISFFLGVYTLSSVGFSGRNL